MPSRQGVPEVLVGGRRARGARAVGARLRQRRGRASAQRRRAAAVHRVGLADRAGGLRRFIGRTRRCGLSGPGARARHASPLRSGGRDRGRPRPGARAHRAAPRSEVRVADRGVHGRIIAAQTEALRARDEVRERFTALSLRGAPADFIVHQLAQTLGAPVILENLAHEVVAGEVPPALEEELFTEWELRSRAAHRGRAAARARASGRDDWLIVPVEARGIRWGSLIALPGPPHPAGRAAVLEQGAIALAIGRLADGDADEWARIGRRTAARRPPRGPLRRHRGRRGAPRGGGAAAARRSLYGIVVSGAAVTAERGRRGRPRACAVARSPGRRRRASPRRRRPCCCRFRPTCGSTTQTALAARRARWPAMTRIARSSPRSARGRGLDAALVSLHEAVDLARGRRRRPGARPHPAPRRGPPARAARHRAARRPPTARARRADARAADRPRPRTRGGDLLDVLEAMLAHPGNRTAAASASHLSRSVFYQRIALIEDLLGVDLDDGETQTALHLALLVRRVGGAVTRHTSPVRARRTPCGGSRAPSTPSACRPRGARPTPGRSSIDGSAGSTNSTVASPDEHDEHLVGLDVASSRPGVISHTPDRRRRSRRDRRGGRRPGDDLSRAHRLVRERQGRGIRHRARRSRVMSRTPARARRGSSAGRCGGRGCGRRGRATSASR